MTSIDFDFAEQSLETTEDKDEGAESLPGVGADSIEERDPGEIESVDLPNVGEVESEVINGRITIAGNDWHILECKTEMDYTSLADFGQATIVPDNHGNPPRYDDEVVVNVDIDILESEIPERQEMYEEEITIFTGSVTNYRAMGDGRWFILFDNFGINITEQHVTIRSGNSLVDDRDTIREVISQLSGEPNSINFQNFEETEPEPQLELPPTPVEKYFSLPTSFQTKRTYEDKKASEVLDEIARQTDSKWWIDRFNEFNFGKPDSNERELEFVIEANDGTATPPYRSVAVIADDIVAEGGWGQDHLEKATQPVYTLRLPTAQEMGAEGPETDEEIEEAEDQIESGELIDVGDTGFIEGQIQEPVFTYKNTGIKTPAQAQKTALGIAEELQEQRAEGKVSVVGRPDINILDIIIMPEYLTGYTEDEVTYLVKGITHTLNNSDGFITDIEVSHPPSAGMGQVSNVEGGLRSEYSESDEEDDLDSGAVDSDSICKVEETRLRQEKRDEAEPGRLRQAANTVSDAVSQGIDWLFG